MDLKINIQPKQILYIAIALLLFGWIVISQMKNNSLRKEINKLKVEKTEQIDSFAVINNQHLKKIQEYEVEISDLNRSLDSLQKVKNRVVVKKDGVVVSSNMSAAVKQLKQNLNKWSD